MEFEQLDWKILDRLRAGFLSGTAANGVYWKSHDDLEQYDRTFGERIGWKWDAVLKEISARGWQPLAGKEKLTVLDWGCGSGIASRRVISHFGADRFGKLFVSDHSPLARTYAAGRARAQFPNLEVDELSPDVRDSSQRLESRRSAGSRPVFTPDHSRRGEGVNYDVLVVSHVLNELDAAAREEISSLVRRSQCVLWVEPGTHAMSRDLIGLREKVRGEFRMVAPCTHNAICGLLVPHNAQHWCHAHAAPPPSLYANSAWVKFGQRAGIDLRSLPYSFLVMEKLPQPVALPDGGRDPIARVPEPEAGADRIIDEPRQFKGHAKILSCAEPGVRELMLQKRDAPELFKQLKRELDVPIYRWALEGDRIHDGQALYAGKVDNLPDVI